MQDTSESLVALQLGREQKMAEMGYTRARSKLVKDIERGGIADTAGGLTLTKRAVEPVAMAITAFVEKSMNGGAGRRHVAAKILKDIDPYLASYIAVRDTINLASRQESLRKAAVCIAGHLDAELLANDFLEEAEPLFRSVKRNAIQRGLVQARQANAVKEANRHFNVVPEKRTQNEMCQLGAKLVELVIETLDVVESNMVKLGRHAVHRLSLTPEITEYFEKYNEASLLLKPMFLPMAVPPKPWTEPFGGAYHGTALREACVITRPSKEALELLEKGKLGDVYSALNTIQETPWRVNKEVLEVMKQAWEMDAGLSCLPRRNNEEIPEPPQYVQDAERGSQTRKEWRRHVRGIHDRNAKNTSARFELDRSLSLAEDCQDFERIYFPHRLDFRGRIYASAVSLNPQGADHARALIEFAEGKPLGKSGLRWLAIHGANLFGVDKVSFDDREKWAYDHLWDVLATAREPLNHLWWTEADKPWSFLAWCFEWAGACTHVMPGASEPSPTRFVSHLPIALDGSCNGIQHFSAMLRDPVGGKAVNLVASQKPQDIYQEVANQVIDRLKNHVELGDEYAWIASGWLQFGITRKSTKRQVMVLPYGGTYKSCMDYTRQHVQERIADGEANPFGEELVKASTFLTSLIWNSIGDVVVAARDAMKFIQDCTRVAARDGLGISWTTPSGFPVWQRYRDLSDKRIRTEFCGALIFFRGEETDNLNRSKQVNAAAPNFVHSMDAAALVRTVNACPSSTSFAMIHDSYGTHAADTDTLARVLREQFVQMYTDNDVLQQFRDSVEALVPPEMALDLPTLPPKGTLDLSNVLQSEYFFA